MKDKEKQNKVNEYFANTLIENCKKIVEQADKEIEEMAKVIKSANEIDCIRICDTCKYYDDDTKCISFRQAIALYNAGYRKLPEDSVVLSREEYIDLSRNYVGEQVAQARKETSEQDFNAIIKALETKKASIITHYGIKESVGADIAIRTVKELAKQFGVEIKE